MNKAKDFIIFIAHIHKDTHIHTHTHTHTHTLLLPFVRLSALEKRNQGVKKSKVVLSQDSSIVIPVCRDVAKNHIITGINLTAKYTQRELGKKNDIYSESLPLLCHALR